MHCNKKLSMVAKAVGRQCSNLFASKRFRFYCLSLIINKLITWVITFYSSETSKEFFNPASCKLYRKSSNKSISMLSEKKNILVCRVLHKSVIRVDLCLPFELMLLLSELFFLYSLEGLFICQRENEIYLFERRWALWVKDRQEKINWFSSTALRKVHGQNMKKGQIPSERSSRKF